MEMLRNTFLKGRMNKDVDLRLLAPGEYRDANNIRVANSEGGDVGAIEKTLSNIQLTTLNLGANITTIGSLEDTFENKLYWAVKSDSGSYIIEYDDINSTPAFVLQDERIGNLNVLAFDAKKRVQMILFIDSDNNNRLLGFTDNNTGPKLINVERAKTYGLDGFNLDMILLIKKPPLYPPVLSLSSTGNQENNIEDKFITVWYRYRYLDGEYSATSPHSEVAFEGQPFSYRFNTGTNESMLNNYNNIGISFNTGSDLVTDVEIGFKYSGSNNLYVIESFNKAEKGWADDSIESYDFNNSKTYKVLPQDELFRLYDSVPLKALAIAIINNRIIFGNYTENYDLLECDSSPISSEYTVSKVQTAIVSGVATRSLKTNRDYEIARVYLDGYGRMTTPLTSDTNTLNFGNDECVTKNRIKVTLPNKAPCFAKYCRFFIKESKTGYDTIVPTLFFFEGNYIYFYIQASDVNKVSVNDFLIVKSDTEGIKSDIIKLKVLEVERKEKDFISETDGGQPSGFYIKTSIQNEDVRFDVNSYNYYRFDHYDQSENSDKISDEDVAYINTVFKGDTLDDLTPVSLFSGSDDLRYEIEIIDINTVDKFRWRTQQTDGTFSSWDDNTGVGYDITGISQAIDGDLSVTFDATTGHGINDRWLIKVNNALALDEDNRAFAIYAYDDTITIGSVITIKAYMKKERDNDIDRFTLELISSGNYESLEEWYYGEEVYDQITSETDFDQDLDHFYFRKADVVANNINLSGDSHYTTINANGEFDIMIIESRLDSRNSSRDVYADSYIEVRALDQLPIFEKEIENSDSNLDLFYEISRTYVIDDDGYHLGFDANDVDQDENTSAELILPVFNCISWGNAFESYKVRDEFNARGMTFDTRPSVPIENYRQNKRISSFTYSGVFEQTTNYNALNEFNLSLSNFKNLDDKYGSIQRIVTWNTDLDVFQEDKVTKVFYDKQLLYNRDGQSNLVTSDKILDGIKPYTGEFGISLDPDSLIVFGNYIYWTDRKRGFVLRKGNSGIEIISNFGMRDWFKDVFRDRNLGLIIGGYDSYFGQYIVSLDNQTLSFDEKVKGWTSFHSYIPDGMLKLNNRFYTLKNGNLWLHNSEASYCNYYDTSYEAKVVTVFNQEHQLDKIFKTLVIEGDRAWSIALSTNYTNGNIALSEFNQRESRWFAYIRQNESSSDLSGGVQGIGNIVSNAGLTISFNIINEETSIGDVLYQVNNGLPEQIGTIENIDWDLGIITVDAIVNAVVDNNFGYSKKDSRIEGSTIRGYYMEVELTDSSDTANELFAVNAGVVKSYL